MGIGIGTGTGGDEPPADSNGLGVGIVPGIGGDVKMDGIGDRAVHVGDGRAADNGLGQARTHRSGAAYGNAL